MLSFHSKIDYKYVTYPKGVAFFRKSCVFVSGAFEFLQM